MEEPTLGKVAVHPSRGQRSVGGSGRSFDPARQGEPLSYYHRTGPFGHAFAAYQAHPANPRIAVLGLGGGAMACYATAGQAWTFYEIDPAVLRIAQDTTYFTYLAQATNAAVSYKLGDARLRLREASPESLLTQSGDLFGQLEPQTVSPLPDREWPRWCGRCPDAVGTCPVGPGQPANRSPGSGTTPRCIGSPTPNGNRRAHNGRTNGPQGLSVNRPLQFPGIGPGEIVTDL